MNKTKKTIKQKKRNKQNNTNNNSNENNIDKRLLQKGAKTDLQKLSELNIQYERKQFDQLTNHQLTPWYQSDQSHKTTIEENNEIRKKSLKSFAGQRYSFSSLKRKHPSFYSNKQKLRINNQNNIETQPNADRRICLTQSSQYCNKIMGHNIPSNLLNKPPKYSNIIDSTNLTHELIHYSISKIGRYSNIKTGRQSNIKTNNYFNKSQTNINRSYLKYKQQITYLKRYPKQPIDVSLFKIIGEHAIFEKCRQKSKYQFQ